MLNTLAKSRVLRQMLTAIGLRSATQALSRIHIRRIMRARYDAAITNDENRRHWANADALSPDAAAAPTVRRTLRMRSRYEVANNSYARGIVDTLANYTIGAGPRLQMLTEGRRGQSDRRARVRIMGPGDRTGTQAAHDAFGAGHGRREFRPAHKQHEARGRRSS